MLRDVRSLERAFRDDPARAAIDLASAQQRLRDRRASVPNVSFPDELPIAQHIDEIKQALNAARIPHSME